MIFWKTWTPAQRIAFWLGALGLLFSLAFMTYGATRDLSDLAPWWTLQSGKALNLPIYEFQSPLHSMVVEAPYYVIYDYQVPGEVQLDAQANYLLVGLVFFGFSLVLAALPSIEKTFVYYGSLGVVLYALSKCKWELLGLFGYEDRTFLMVVLAAYGLTNFVFYAFLTRVGLLARVGFYVLLSGVLLFVVATQSTVANGLLELGAHSLNLPVFALILLSILTATEVPFALLRVMGGVRSAQGAGPLLPYLLFLLAYLGNAILALLYANESLSGPSAAIGAFLLLPLCTLAGLWGWKHKELLYKGGLSYAGGGAVLYLGLATMGLSLIGWSLHQVNDSLLEAQTDIVLLLQVGLSAALLPYVWINLRRPFMEGLPIARIMYQPMRFPILGIYVFGIATAVILYMQSNQVAYAQWQAGREIAAGDAYRLEDEPLLAVAAYQEAALVDKKGTRAQYTLGDWFYRQEKFGESAYRFEAALLRRPSPQAHLMWARSHHQLGATKLENQAIAQGLRRFPQSAELNLYYAQLLGESGQVDSARSYYQAALASDPNSPLGAVGLLALAAEYGPAADLDSAFMAGRYPLSPSYQANWLANAAKQGRRDLPGVNYALLPDSLLDNGTYFYLRNATLARLGTPDATLADTLDHYAFVPSNFLFQWGLNYVLALHHYANHRLDLAVPLFEKQTELVAPQYLPWYSHQVGQLLWQAGANSKAEEFFDYSLRSQLFSADPIGGVDYGYFLLGQENRGRTVAYWQQLAARDSAHNHLDSLAERMIALLESGKPQPAPQPNAYRAHSDSLFQAAMKRLKAADTTGLSDLIGRALAANPYREDVVLAASEFYQSKGQDRRAYDLLLDAKYTNPRSAQIVFAYALLSMQMGYDKFAETAMEELRTARGMNPALYKEKAAQLEAARRERDAAIERKLKAQGF